MNTNQTFDPITSAYGFGQKAATNAAEELATICIQEKLRIQKTNEPAIHSISLRIDCRHREWQELKAKLQLLSPTPRRLIERTRYHKVIAILFSIAGLISSRFALQPFGIGWEVWVFSFALALTGAFWTDVILQRYHSKRVIELLFIAAFLASIAGLLALASLRGDVVVFLVRRALEDGI